MVISFNKYQGAGNDFIIIDNREGIFDPGDSELVSRLCDRRFGIGADGLILISKSPQYDFEMKYFNSDGMEGTMCGNGGRCASKFAIESGIAGNDLIFKTIDGVHKASFQNEIIRLQMNDVKETSVINCNYFLNTGSPHYVIFRNNVESINVNEEGKKIRWAKEFAPGGTNVNFVEKEDNGIFVRTFERGVEEETLSCGTGVTASAIASVLAGQFDTDTINIRTRGGNLSVSFRLAGQKITDIWLSGPATFVFKGSIDI
jgi:diaminopimelate epimerase